MIRIALVLDWYCDDQRQDPFWKVVEMPAIPPIGCDIFVQGDGRGIDEIVTVKSVLWCEGRPDVFEVEVGEVRVTSAIIDHQRIVAGMEGNGWAYEATHEFTEHYQSPPATPQQVAQDRK